MAKNYLIELITIPGYTLANYFSRAHHIHGGVCCYVKSNLKFETIDLKIFCHEIHFEVTAIKLLNSNTIICTLYRSPLGDFDIFISELEKMLTFLEPEENKIIISGDFNLNFALQNKQVELCTDLFATYNLYGQVTTPTRLNGDCGTLIDNIFTNVDDMLHKVHEYKLSDHMAVIAAFPSNDFYQKTYIKRRCNINPKTIAAAKDEIQKLKFDYDIENSTDNMQNINFFGDFKQKILEIFDNFFPVKTVLNKPHVTDNSWNDENVQKEQKLLDLLFDIARDNPENEKNKTNYDLQKIALNNARIRARQKMNTQKINTSKNKQKALWQVVNNNVKFKKTSINFVPDLYTDYSKSELTHDPVSRANVLNSFFVDTPKQIRTELAESLAENFKFNYIPEPKTTDECMILDPVTSTEIEGLISNLSDSNAPDVDFLTPKLIKNFSKELSIPLSKLINFSFESGIYPDELKTGKISPIFKSGDKSDPNNYRPITILPVFSKIYERVMYNRIIQFLFQNNVINMNQHGFLKNKNTITAIFEFIEKILKGLDEREAVLALFVDLSKAFDCVDHELLLKKLASMGLRGIVQDWIASYLLHRRQVVGLNTAKGHYNSDTLENNIGIPQGSILGPLFFILYVNDLIILEKNAFLVKYADDTSMMVRNKNIDILIEETNKLVTELNMWFKQNKLKLNASKTNLVGFQLNSIINKFENKDVFCGEQKIEFTNCTKLLGITIDKNLKWTVHIDNLCKRLSKLVFAIRVLKNNVETSSLKSVYFAHFHSILIYGIEIWGQASEYLVSRVFKLQKKALRLICNVSPYASCRNLKLFKQEQILPLPALYISNVLVFFKKHPEYFSENQFVHEYNTRHKNNLQLVKHNTTSYEKGLLYSGQIFYNKLPNDLKAESNINSFKNKIKLYLLENDIYSVSEFSNI